MDMVVDLLAGRTLGSDAVIVSASKVRRDFLMFGMPRCVNLSLLLSKTDRHVREVADIALISQVLFGDLHTGQLGDLFHFAAWHRAERMRHGYDIKTFRPTLHGPEGIKGRWERQVEKADCKAYPEFHEYGSKSRYHETLGFRILAVPFSESRSVGYRIESSESLRSLVFLTGNIEREWASQLRSATDDAQLKKPVGALIIDVRQDKTPPAVIPEIAAMLSTNDVKCINTSPEFEDACEGISFGDVNVSFLSTEKRLQPQFA